MAFNNKNVIEKQHDSSVYVINTISVLSHCQCYMTPLFKQGNQFSKTPFSSKEISSLRSPFHSWSALYFWVSNLPATRPHPKINGVPPPPGRTGSRQCSVIKLSLTMSDNTHSIIADRIHFLNSIHTWFLLGLRARLAPAITRGYLLCSHLVFRK